MSAPVSEGRDADASPAPSPPPENTIGVSRQGRPRMKIRAFFKRAWKVMKKPFVCFRPKRESSAPRETEQEPHPEPVDSLKEEFHSCKAEASLHPEDHSSDEPAPVEEPEPVQEPKPVQEPSGPQDSAKAEGNVAGLSSVPVATDYKPRNGDVKTFYTFESVLGKGSFGAVYKANRKSDGKKVAIKHLPKNEYVTSVEVPDSPEPLYREVAMMVRLRRARSCPFVIELYEWFNKDNALFLVMELPQPCMPLRHFIVMMEGVEESFARIISQQLVVALDHCIKCGVFHNDIHLDNILVMPETLHIKLIDFGCAHLLDEEGYDSKEYIGAFVYRPPEAFESPKYHAVPTSIWFLGNVLFAMVNRDVPFCSVEDILEGRMAMWRPGISKKCRDLVMKCLSPRPESRPAFDKILQHPWFTSKLLRFKELCCVPW